MNYALRKAIARASIGETIVLVYSSHWIAKRAFEDPDTSCEKVFASMEFRFPLSGGRVMFMSIDTPCEKLGGLLADIIFMGDAEYNASDNFKEMAYARSVRYFDRRNRRPMK